MHDYALFHCRQFASGLADYSTGARFARRRLPLHYIRMPTPDRPALTDQSLRNQFPILESGLYLNHAAIGPWPRCAAEAMQAFAAENMESGPARYAAWVRRENALREDLASLIGAGSGDSIALLKNTTEGISAVAWGLDWRSGDNLVLPRFEFASNRLPWLAQSGLGVEIREIDIRAAEDAESALIDAMDTRTRLVAVSSVQWSDGLRLDLQRLGEACRRRQALFFVDAIQQLGALPLDVEACRIDFLAADAHKWLLGPEGIALFYSRDAAREHLTLHQRGWHMFDDPWNFEREDWTPATSARRFEAGSPNSAGQAAMHASLGLLRGIGMDRVGKRVLQNTDFLLDRLQSIPGLTVASNPEPKRRSGIVSFNCASLPSQDLRRQLAARACSCAVRDGTLRVSPHFYQDERVLEAFLEQLVEILP
jgi:selenocysteine lyase/cysteine desulfurase